MLGTSAVQCGSRIHTTFQILLEQLRAFLHLQRLRASHYRREYDWEQEKSIKIKNRRSEWEVHFDSNLAIVPMEWWRAAQRKLTSVKRPSPTSGKRLSRNEASATTLLSGTLFCQDCGDELKLARSTAKYKQMGCLNGPTGIRGCGLSTSKSTRIIDGCLTTFIRESLLTEAFVGDLVVRANALLQEEANKPKKSIAPLKATAVSLQRTINKLMDQIEGEENESRLKVYDARITQRQNELDAVRKEIRKTERCNAAPPPPLDAGFVEKCLADLAELLNGDIPVAAEAIRSLTGPIKIRQEKIPGRKRGARWIATFTPDFLRLLNGLARKKDYPESITLEFLSARNWITPVTVQVAIENVPAYERLKAELVEKHSQGASKRSLAVAYELSEPYVTEILIYSKTGKMPSFVRGRRTGNQIGKMPKYLEIQDDVVHLRDKEEMAFPQIADWLAEKRGIVVSQATVLRAWDKAHAEELRNAAENCRDANRGHYSQIGVSKRGQICQMLKEGTAVRKIAVQVSCSKSTVYRISKDAHKHM